jgi:type II secretion system protein G
LRLFVGACGSALVAIVGFFGNPGRDPDRVRFFVATRQVQQLSSALDRYKSYCSDYPTASRGLNALIANQGEDCWKGPYLKNVPLDPWHGAYVYVWAPGAVSPEVLSWGADRKPGGKFFDEDISSRNPRLAMPQSPTEFRRTLIYVAVWIATCVCFVACSWALLRGRFPIRPS